jgi:hypothetical protein
LEEENDGEEEEDEQSGKEEEGLALRCAVCRQNYFLSLLRIFTDFLLRISENSVSDPEPAC